MKSKLYYIIPVVFFVILILIVFLLPGKKTAPTTIYTTPAILPTKITTFSSSSPSSLIPVYTGGTNERLPQEIVDLTASKKALRKKAPLNQSTFVVTFDFATDKFIIVLNDPKETSKSAFEAWLKANYPAIPLDRFTFK